MDSNSDFKRYFLYSISFHVAVLLLLLVFGRKFEIDAPPPTQIVMIRLVRGTGDLQAPVTSALTEGGAAPKPQTAVVKPPTPPATIEKPPPVPTVKVPEKTAPEKKPEKSVNLNPSKPKTPEKSAPVQAPAKPAPKIPSVEEQKISQALSQVQQELQERETQVQSGSGATGSGTGPGPSFGSPAGEVSAQDGELVQYRSQVRSKIIREWVRTAVGGNGETMRARILVRINASGAVISRSFAKTSGDPAFDNSALRAVERASPLPPPPPSAQYEALNEGFVVDFSSRMLGR